MGDGRGETGTDAVETDSGGWHMGDSHCEAIEEGRLSGVNVGNARGG